MAFDDCTGLTSIVIGSGVESIGSRAFGSCTGLMSISIPDGVTSIGRDAFSDCSGIITIDLGSGVVIIESCAFANCSSLTAVMIPNSVEQIADAAFLGCENLSDVYFAGTEEEWNSIIIREENECLTEAVIHFNDRIGFHNAVVIPAVEPSCTKDGHTEGAYCSECGKVLYVQEPIPATGHIYGEDGFCTVCGEHRPSEGLEYISNGDGTCYVSGIGTCTDTDLVIPSVSPDGDRVTGIGYSAFSGCRSLTSVNLPDSITSIGGYAFNGCISLTSINIPNSVTSIDYLAFYCSSLTSIDIPNSVTSIGEGAFSRCTALTSITVEEENPAYHSDGNCLIETATGRLIQGCNNSVIPNDGSVKIICNSAFYGCSDLTSVILPDGVISIDNMAFANCSSLASVNLPDSITSIGGYAFEYCSSLTSIVIPDSVTSIGGGAFYDCSGIKSLTIGDGVSYIEASMFYKCHPESLTIGSGLAKIEEEMLYGLHLKSIEVDDDNQNYRCIGNCLIEIETGLLIKGFDNSVIPNDGSVTSIGNSAFYGCSGLKSINIPDSVTSIGHDAFMNCTRLTFVNIPENVTEIGHQAFYGCSGLISVVLHNGLTTIDLSTFCSCPKLESVTIPASVTSIVMQAFSGCSSLKTIAYSGSEEQWNAIELGERNDCLKNADVWFNHVHTPMTIAAVEPTCSIIGKTEGSVCSVCGAFIQMPQTIPAKGHIYENGYCTVCGYPTSSEGLEYTSNGDGTCYVSGIGTCTDTDIVFPAADPDGNMVTGISGAFQNNVNLTSIVIPDTVTSIGNYAFNGCHGLTSIVIPDSVTSIGEYAFYYCQNLSIVTYTGTEEQWDSISIGGNNKWLTNAAIRFSSDSVESKGLAYTSNGDGTCYVSGIGTCMDNVIVIPSVSPGGDRVTAIGDSAFTDRTNITTVIIPEGVTSINYRAFWNCYRLVSIIMPESLTSIGDEAFYYCNALSSIIIPENVTSIGGKAFFYCDSLTTIYLGKSVTSIGNGAFDYCNALEWFSYSGTDEQLERISIGVNNDQLYYAIYSFLGLI